MELDVGEAPATVTLNAQTIRIHDTDITPYALGNDYVPDTVKSDCVIHQEVLSGDESRAKDKVAKLELALKQAQLELSSIQDSQTLYKSLTAPIRRLPPEIISKFLIHALDCPRIFDVEDVARLTSLQLVCRKWRDTLNSTPLIWKSLSITPKGGGSQLLQDLSRWFGRAGEGGLKLAIRRCSIEGYIDTHAVDFSDRDSSDYKLTASDRSLLDFLVHRTKWTELGLYRCDDKFFHALVAAMQSYGTENTLSSLESFAIGHGIPDEHSTVNDLCPLFHYMPNIKYLSIQTSVVSLRPQITSTVPFFPHLTHLHLSHLSFPAAVLLQLLSGMPTLTDMVWQRAKFLTFQFGPPVVLRPKIQMTSVQRMSFIDSPPHCTRGWEWPNLKWLRFQYTHMKNREEDYVESILKDLSFPSLSGVSFETSYLQSRIMAKLVARLNAPNVTVLRVTDCSFIHHLRDAARNVWKKFRHIVFSNPNFSKAAMDKLVLIVLGDHTRPRSATKLDLTLWSVSEWRFPDDSSAFVTELELVGVRFEVGSCPLDVVEFWEPRVELINEDTYP